MMALDQVNAMIVDTSEYSDSRNAAMVPNAAITECSQNDESSEGYIDVFNLMNLVGAVISVNAVRVVNK